MRPERRQWLRLPAAVLAAQVAAQFAFVRGALAAGSVEKGIHRLRGDVRVNGAAAREGMDIKGGDIITTGANSEVVFVTGKDAFLIRANSRVEAQGVLGALVLSGLRIVTGAMLSVFSPGEKRTLTTATATIGIVLTPKTRAKYVGCEPLSTTRVAVHDFVDGIEAG